MYVCTYTAYMIMLIQCDVIVMLLWYNSETDEERLTKWLFQRLDVWHWSEWNFKKYQWINLAIVRLTYVPNMHFFLSVQRMYYWSNIFVKTDVAK